MATESSPDQAWIVRFKPFASTSSQSSHLTSVRALTADQGTHFDVKIGTEFSLPEVSGYIATFDEATKAKLETLPSVRYPQSERMRHAALRYLQFGN